MLSLNEVNQATIAWLFRWVCLWPVRQGVEVQGQFGLPQENAYWRNGLQVQGDQSNIVVLFWYLVKRDASVRYCTAPCIVHWTSQVLQGIRTTRPWRNGLQVDHLLYREPALNILRQKISFPDLNKVYFKKRELRKELWEKIRLIYDEDKGIRSGKHLPIERFFFNVRYWKHFFNVRYFVQMRRVRPRPHAVRQDDGMPSWAPGTDSTPKMPRPQAPPSPPCPSSTPLEFTIN